MQVFQPPTAGRIGPGMLVNAQTDFIGPLPLGTAWQVRLLPSSGEFVAARSAVFSQSSTYERVLGFQLSESGVSSWLTLPQQASVVHGDDARLVVDVSTPVGGIVDTATVPVTYDALTGLQYILPQVVNAPIVSGGFTDADRADAQLVLASVSPSFPLFSGASVSHVVQLASLFTHPPPELLIRGAQLILFGRGSLVEPPEATQVNSYGARVQFEVIPQGFGQRNGQVIEFTERIAQFVAVRSHGPSLNYVADIRDEHTDGHYWIWGGPFPVRIDYDISPGCSVRWTWLTMSAPGPGT